MRALPDDVWLREGGLLMVSTTAAQDRAIDEAVRAADKAGAPEHAVALDRDGVAKLVESPTFRRGVFFPECATVQPARLVRALRRAVLDAGVALHEHTRVENVADGVVTTARGSVRADAIVVATNAAMSGWGPVRRHVTNFGSYVVLTEPVPGAPPRDRLGGRPRRRRREDVHPLLPDDERRTHADGERHRADRVRRPCGRTLYAGRTHRRPAPNAVCAGSCPGLAAARVERSWGGPIDVSADHLPFFGTVPGTRIHYGLGYSGHGVGPSWLGGQILASLAVGRDDEWTQLPLARRRVPALPPEPLKRIGGGVVRAAIIACEEADERGARPSLIARAGAAIPRAAPDADRDALDRCPRSRSRWRTSASRTATAGAAVDGVTIAIREGEFFSLLGPSGCGKTTTLRMIAGFVSPDAGRVVLQGRDVTTVPANRRPVNMVFQHYALFPHMSVYDNVAFGLKMAKVPRSSHRQRVDEMLEVVELTGYDRRHIRNLSGGQQQRVALARALVNRPAALLLDEPLGALDVKLRKQMQLELKRIQADLGTTFVYVTHDQDEALAMSDRIGVMNSGRIEQVGTPREIYEQPDTAFVADFIGSLNVLDVDGKRVAVRPERVHIGPPSGGSALLGTVEDVVYLGMYTQFHVATELGTVVSHRIADNTPVDAFTVGTRVAVSWEPEHESVLGGE